jgi:multimeric flavodoxin WrbA
VTPTKKSPAGDRLRAIFLLATLKPSRSGKEFSHTATLSEVVAECFRSHNVACEIVRLADYNIKAGTKSSMGKGDEWPGILRKVLGADIIVFATPVWWGIQSSLMQRAIERLDELHEEILETGRSRLINKVGGIVVTGAEDGEQHITGNLANFLLAMGVTLPPQCAVTYLGDYERATRKSLTRRFREEKGDAIETMARHLSFFARMLRDNNIPREG